MILAKALYLAISVAAACKPGDLQPLLVKPTKNMELTIDRHQEVQLEGETALPKILSIQGTTPHGKPALNVMSGMQILEKGQMKSYPYRISIKMQESEKDWDRPLEVTLDNAGKKIVLKVKWVAGTPNCTKPSVK